jgi:hypothetical protein
LTNTFLVPAGVVADASVVVVVVVVVIVVVVVVVVAAAVRTERRGEKVAIT